MVKTIRQFSVRHEIHNSTKLNTDHKSTHKRECMGMRWFSGTVANQSGSLSSYFRLCLNPGTDTTDQKSIKVTVTLTNRNGEKFVRTFMEESAEGLKHCFFLDKTKVGRGEELVVVTLNYDVEVKGLFVEKPKTRDFGDLDPVLTDVVLVAGGERFHVNKAILTTHSAHFRELLNTGNPEYELEGIAPKVLQELLQVIYHAPEINDYNVEELLEAARKLDVPLVTRNCNDYLKKSSCWIVDDDKQKLVREYNLDLLELRMQKDFEIEGDLDDMVLNVEDQRFHVNRGILATHSSYFYSMFFGGFRESEQAEIKLKYIDPATFQALLRIIYHVPRINEFNVENLLEAARMYDIPAVTAFCKTFLEKPNNLDGQLKYRLWKEYLQCNRNFF